MSSMALTQLMTSGYNKASNFDDSCSTAAPDSEPSSPLLPCGDEFETTLSESEPITLRTFVQRQKLGVPGDHTPEEPITPRQCLADRSYTTPPLFVPQDLIPLPALLRAFKKDSIEEVLDILQGSPDVATEPFWDHNCEPPICAAARLKCNPEILGLLLKYGASLDESNVKGQTAAQLMQPPRPQVQACPWPRIDVYPEGLRECPAWGYEAAAWRQRALESQIETFDIKFEG